MIPTWKRPKDLQRCLNSLLRQVLQPREILISYREDDIESKKIIDEFINQLPITTVLVKIPGVVYAEKKLIENASSEILVFIDDDAEAPPFWLRYINNHFEKNSKLIAVGGPDEIQTEEHLRVTKSVVGKLTWFGKVIGNHHHKVTSLMEVQFLKGVNMAIRKEFIPPIDLNLQSEKFQGNGCHWELDIFLGINSQFSSKGRILFDPKLELKHFSFHGQVDPRPNLRNNARNYIYILLKHFGIFKCIPAILYFITIGNERIPGLLKLCQMIFTRAPSQVSNYMFSWLGFYEGVNMYLNPSFSKKLP